MRTHQKITQLIRLHERAEFCADEYKRLMESQGEISKALRQLRKMELLQSRISVLIRNFARP